MIKKLAFFVAIVLVFAACKSTNENQDVVNSDTTVVQIPNIPLEDFDSLAGEFVEMQVQVSGIVDHVCKHGGKKLLLVNQDGTADVHVETETPFNDSLVGSEVTVTGIVTEFKVDEAYCQQLEGDDIDSHSDGDNDMHDQKAQQAQFFRDSMQKAGVDHLSFYSIEFISFN